MADLDDLCNRALGEFILRERIGEGGFGAVYLCDQPLLGRKAVVKVLKQRARRHDLAVQRFQREAQLTSLLDHPYAAHVYAFGAEDDGVLWIAMELVHGITLNRWLAERGPMPVEQFVPFFERVTEVVQAAHERGIIHRDLKPSNVMVIERAGRLLPKLLDFGVAKVLDEVLQQAPPTGSELQAADDALPPDEDAVDPERTAEMRKRHPAQPQHGPYRLTPAGAIVGSPQYMAPEQWSNAMTAGPASDLYSLAVVAYEALTGRRPFDAASPEELGELHRCAPVPRLGAGFSSGFDTVFARALAKQPEDRFDSALNFATALRVEMGERMLARARSAAQQWHGRGKPSELLWRGKVLEELERWVDGTGAGALGRPEVEFAEASRQYETALAEASRQHEATLAEANQRLAEASRRRRAWMRRGGVVLAGTIILTVVGVLLDRASLQARMAERIAVQAEVEQGRQALLHNDLAEAQRHLAAAYRRGDHSPATSFMLARAMQPRLAERARFAASSGRMWSATFSPDGQQIATTDDQAAHLWDANTYALQHALPHGAEVYQAVFSRGGAHLVTACGDGAVRIWNAATGALVRELRRARNDGKVARYFAVAVSVRGDLVAAIDAQGEIAHVWNAATGSVIAELPNDASEWPSIAFSSDGRWLATGGGGDVRVFETTSWKRALVILGPQIRTLAWSPTGPLLATGGAAGDASIWTVPSGARSIHLREVGEAVDVVAYSPDGRLVVTAGRDGTEQVWEASSGKLEGQANYLRGKIWSVGFDPRSERVLAAGASGTVVVTDAALGLPIVELTGPAQLVRVAHFAPNSQRVVGASWDGTVRVWDTTPPYRRWDSPPIGNGSGCGLLGGVEPDQRFIAIGCLGQVTRVWDTAHDRLLGELPSVAAPAGEFAAAFPAVSVDGARAAIARGTAAEIYELPGGRLLRTITHGAPVSAVAFGSGHDVVSGDIDGSVLVTRDGREPVALPLASAGIDVVRFMPDGDVVVADARRRLRVIDPERGVVADLELAARARSLRLSPDGARLVAIASYTGKTVPPTLWDLDHARLVAPLKGHTGRVFAARFIEDGRALLTASNDGTAQLWDAATGTHRMTYRGSSRFVADATVDPSGTMVVTGDGDGSVRWWDIATGRPLWVLAAHKSIVVGVHFEGDGLITRGFGGDVSRWTLPAAENVIDVSGASGIVAE